MTPRRNYVINGIRFRGLLSYSVFAFLSERPHHRDELITRLWGQSEPEEPDKTLRALIARVRLAIEPHGYTVTSFPRGIPGKKSIFKIEELTS
jgi:DNA-binding SARP family transcriptional activator